MRKKLDEKSLILFKGWREGEQIEDSEKRKNETMESREKEEKREEFVNNWKTQINKRNNFFRVIQKNVFVC